ncbi:MAG: 3-phosphoshikimate 1-carboxyvinyltransferase [Planctomycetia bacterium]|nr:3-phosphoshikimate 1-carboxyvinyltransferase [Planctomycetia bacterium]
MGADSYLVEPVTQSLNGTVRPPGSKSLTNRAIVIAALAQGTSTLTNVLDSQDTQVMLESWRRLGVIVEHNTVEKSVILRGCSGQFPQTSAVLWLENSGTSIRFLTAACSVGSGRFLLDGNSRMRQRPILDLVQALNALGANVKCSTESGCPPVEVIADGLKGGRATVAGNISSQYLSALLMAAPCAKSMVNLQITGSLVSEPYVDMTLGVMQQFGATVTRESDGSLQIPPTGYDGATYDIEPDASAASYFFAAAAISGGEITVTGLGKSSLQGDLHFVDALARMGCDVTIGNNETTVRGRPLRGIEIDMNAISDTAQTLAAVAVFADGPTTIRNIAHVRHKETDRITAVVTELKRLGLNANEQPDGMTIHPGIPQPATIATYDDHRMAMSFALIGLRTPGIRIANPSCTAKTYPRFFEDLERLCGRQ